MLLRASQVVLMILLLVGFGLSVSSVPSVTGDVAESSMSDPVVIELPGKKLSNCIDNHDGTCNCSCVSDNGGGVFVNVNKPAAGCSSLNGAAC